MTWYLIIIFAFVGGWGVCEFGILYPQAELDSAHILHAYSLAFYQMFSQTYLDRVIRSGPFDTPLGSDDEWCTNNETLASSFTNLHCPDRRVSWIVFYLLMIFLVLANLMLFNLLIAIFSNIYQKIEGFH